MTQRNDKSSMLDYISALSLAILDTRLYINTHTDCNDAYDYLYARKKEYDEAVRVYENKFGPITPFAHPDKEIKWAWQTDNTRMGG